MKKKHFTGVFICCAALAMSSCATDSNDDESCKSGQQKCDSLCQDLTSSVNHCGSCNNNCNTKGNIVQAACVNSQCQINECVNGYKDCDNNPNNGCEQYVGSNGSCTATPPVGGECTNGLQNCSGTCIDINNDANNCGSCGNSCLTKSNVSQATCSNKKCQITACATGYKDCDNNPDNGCETAGECGTTPTTDTCQVTFKYTNADTCATTGGTQDWPVYVIGDMNSWQPADGNMIMTADDKCTRTATINVEKGKALKYKFFVAGWDDNSYHSDPSKAVDNDKNNQTDGSCDAVYEYVEKAPEVVVTPGEPEIEEGNCKATFTYYNQWTNVGSGGAADFDVYLVGSFNTNNDGTWKTTDVAWKMKSDGYGTHTISVDLVQGKSYEYKYYINGWEDDSWKTDAQDGQANGTANMDSCDKSFGTPNTSPIIPPPSEEGKCNATFIYTNKYTNKASGGTADFDVYLVGSMNEWKPEDANLKMTSDGNGTHSITVELKQGEKYSYKYYVKGWEQDSWKSNPDSCSDSDCNSLADMSTCNQVFKYVEVPLGGGDNPSNPPDTPSVPSNSNCYIKSAPTVSDKNISFEIACKDGTTEITEIKGGVAPSHEGLKVTDKVTENNKYSYTVKAGSNEIYVPVWVEDNAFDWHNAVLYFAFTDRFKDGDKSNNYNKKDASVSNNSNANWMGGDFKGLQEKVEEGYFNDLGVNTLWISSVSMNAQGISQGANGDEAHWYSAYHSYWPVSSFMVDDNDANFSGSKSEGVDITAIEPHFGSMKDLENLVEACHKRGIRVLVDFAANHVHKDSPIIAKHPEWINDYGHQKLCDTNQCGGSCWDNYSEKCWFSADLPDIDYGNENARKAMVDHAIWLIKKTNVDGFRVDAVKHMHVQFIKDLRAATDQLYHNSGSMFYMVGETFTGNVGLLNQYIGDDLLHAQFDFPMYYALQSHILGLGNYASVAQLSNSYKSDLMGTFMGNHDVARAISVAAGQNQGKWGNNDEVKDWLPYLKMKTAWTILLTNPGVPLIYYGDEYGLEGSNDPDNRRMMEFGDALNSEQKSMLGYVQRLGQIRREHKAITLGHRENLSYGGGYWCYKLKNDSESIIVGIARADGGDNSGCDLKGSYTLEDLLSDGHETLTNVTGLDLNERRLQVYLVK
ncbi:MAG: hypothetical protein IJU23_06815 [Proteobacteria bacterium]|nr:hypothetical protein [Pseudomonadota bacterium]